MTAISGIAGKFFEACETGKGWKLATVHGLDEGVADVYA
jgi:hypothetical protein